LHLVGACEHRRFRGTDFMECRSDHSGLMFAARITLPHF